MGAVINIKNSKIGGNAKVLNNATIMGQASVELDSVTINGNAVVLDNLNIQDFCQEIEKGYVQMTQEEYASIQRVLRQKDSGREKFLRLLKNHLASFAEGVAASAVAACLMK